MVKSDKKISREIIQKGLAAEIENALIKSESILKNWRTNQIDVKTYYSELFSHIKEFDKNLAFYYDGLTPIDYLSLISRQISQNFVGMDDIKDLSEESKEIIYRYLSFNK